MKIVTDAAANLTPEQAAELEVQVVPFQVTFNGNTYRDGADITPDDLYRLYIENPDQYPITSQPSVGDFVSVYEKCCNEEILSVHLSSGLSGAYSSAVHAARMTSEERVTVVDSKTVGPTLGWMVEIAAFGAKIGWSKVRIMDAMQKIKDNSVTMVSFSDMKYLLHSGRISHLKGLMASLLRIKPIIGMNPEDGRYDTVGQEITMSRVVRKMADLVAAKFSGQKIRLQLMHGSNLPGVALLRAAISEVMNATEDKLVPVTLVLGAHAGPTVIGLAAGPETIFEGLRK
jgi:DegV family protein with EDD domain